MSKQAAARATEQSGRPASETRKAGETNARLGITLQVFFKIYVFCSGVLLEVKTVVEYVVSKTQFPS